MEIDGVPWMKYNNALVSATAIPVDVEVTYEQALKALKTTEALFFRYNSCPNSNSQTLHDPKVQSQECRRQQNIFRKIGPPVS